MDPSWIIYGIIGMILLIVLTILAIVIYSGLFTPIQIGAGSPPIGEVKVAYKFGQGPYKTAGHLFNLTVSIVPDLRTFGVYYDDPNLVHENKLRYAVGAILAENGAESDQAKEEALVGYGFKIATFPAVDNAVRTTFPFNTTISIFIAIARVYPALTRYIKDQKLCAHPVLEIYDETTIHFMMPLSRQDDFYVSETIKEQDVAETSLMDSSCISDESDISVVEKSPGESPLGEEVVAGMELKFTATATPSGDEKVESPTDKASEAGSENSTGSSFEQIDEDDVNQDNLS